MAYTVNNYKPLPASPNAPLACRRVGWQSYCGAVPTRLLGDVGQEDWQENDLSVKQGFRILSAYETGNGRIWIITEHDRSSTTILLPEEY